MTHPDVVVVGGGLVGAAAAYELASAGASVVLLDRADPGRATDAGAGILSPATTAEVDPVWVDAARAAGRHHEQLAAARDTSRTRCGILELATRESDVPAFDVLATTIRSRDPSIGEIDPSEARERFPALGRVLRALWSPDAARLDGRSCRAALLDAARDRGATVRAGDVAGLDLAPSRVRGVDLADSSRIACDAVLVAGGAWSSAFEVALGSQLGVHPARGQILHLGTRDATPSEWPIAQPVFGHYLVPWPDERVAVGATYEDDAGFDPRPTAAGIAEVLREALRVAPGLGDAALLDVRVGLRPASADGRPVVGPLPGWDNVAVCTGHGAEGLLLGPWSARVAARALLGEPPDDDVAGRVLEAWRPGRPAGGPGPVA